jgi:phage-related protein
MTLIETVQLQELDNAFIELFEVTLKDANSTTVYLTKGLEEGSQNLYFGSAPTTADPTGGATLNEYIAVPIHLDGIGFSNAGAASRPTLSVANIVSLSRSIENDGETESESSNDADETNASKILDSVGLITNDDFLGATVVYRSTLLSHTKNASDSNFDEYTPTAPVEFPSQTFIVDRVMEENTLMVKFELASPFDVEGKTVPARQAVGKYCSWEYQGIAEGRPGGCSWEGNSDGRWFDVNDNVIDRNNTSSFPTSINEHSLTQAYSVGSRVYSIFRPAEDTYTFDPASAVNTTNNTIDITTANFENGTDVIYNNGGGTDIGGLTNGTTYIILNESDTEGLLDIDTIGLVTNDTTFTSETLIDLTSQGAGSSHTLTRSAGFVKIWEALVAHNSGGTSANAKAPVDSSGKAINTRFWKRVDVCGKTINSCKIRFQGNRVDATLDQSVPLPFGGFPGLLRFR